MEKNPQVDLLVGDADYIFEENKSNKAEKNDGAFAWITNFSKALEKKKFLQNKKYTKAIKQQKFDASYRHVRQGCLMCFRKSFWNEIKEFWYPEIAHDCFLSFYAKLKGTYYALDYPVITYRFHSNNSSMPERGNRMVRLSGLEEERLEIESLIKNINCVAAGDFEKKQLQNAKRWNQNRISLVEKRNFWAGVKLLKYLGFYKHKKHFISDCFFAVRGK